MSQSTAPASTFVLIAVGLTVAFIAYGMLTKKPEDTNKSQP